MILLKLLELLFAGWKPWRVEYTDEMHEAVIAAIHEDGAAAAMVQHIDDAEARRGR